VSATIALVSLVCSIRFLVGASQLTLLKQRQQEEFRRWLLLLLFFTPSVHRCDISMGREKKGDTFLFSLALYGWFDC
jgi:hypothetical protein